MAVPMNFMYRPNAASYGWYVLVDCKLSTRYTERNMNADCNIARRSLELIRLRVPNHELATSNSTGYKGHLQDDLHNHKHIRR
jgi:hypothetical protein